MSSSQDQQIAHVAALDEPVRRDLYRYVAASDGEVTRDEAANALGIRRSLAAFHLDRLVEEGLLEVSFRRLSGRSGPGAGRPSKLYRRSARQVEISLPPRSYELAAQLLVRAVEEARSPETLAALAQTARSFGEMLGAEAREHAGGEPSADALLSAAEEILRIHGFEPRRDASGVIRLRNCPFHALAERHRGLVCGMNLSLMEGVVAGLGLAGIEAVLDPQPSWCCVAFRREQPA